VAGIEGLADVLLNQGETRFVGQVNRVAQTRVRPSTIQRNIGSRCA
jgi:hypothetical protein